MYLSFDLYEYDPYTKIERKVVTVPVSSFGVNEVFASSDGMVYASSSNSGGSNGNSTLWKIDPNSGSMQSVDYNPDGSNFFNFSEDYDGNIYYLASRGSGRKYNPVTGVAGAAGNGSWNGQAFEVNPDGTIYATHTGFMGTNSVNITKNGYSVGTIGGNIGAVNVKASRTPNLAYIYCGPPGYYYSTNGCYPNYPDQGIFRYDQITKSFTPTSFTSLPVFTTFDNHSLWNFGTVWRYLNENDGTYSDISMSVIPRNARFDSINLSNKPHYSKWLPVIEIVLPTPSQILSDVHTAFIPSVKVSNLDGYTLNLAYYIDSETSSRDAKTISNTVTAQSVSFNALNIGALTEGSHTMKFTASDGLFTTTKSVDFTVDNAVPTLGTLTTEATDTTIKIKGSASDSISGMNTEPYRYAVGSNVSAWMASSPYTQPNLTPNTGYNIKFEAKDNAGHIASQEQTVRTKAQVPSLTLGSAMETSLDISFNDSNPSITKYQVKIGEKYVSATGALTTTPSWITLSNKKVKVTGLAPNTSYSFQAKARNELDEETVFSSLYSGTTLASPPAPITTEIAQRWMKLNWPAIVGIASYDVEADGVVMNNGTSTSFSHNGLVPNTQHNYRVRANNAGGAGNWSSLINKFTLPDPPAVPTNIQIVPLQTEMTVSWDIVARAESYDVEADGVIIDNGNQTTYVHRGLQVLTDHTYRIRAKNPGGISDWSQPATKRTLPYPPNTPDNVTADLSIHQVTVNWSKADRADAYEIEADGLIIDTGNQTTYLHEGLDALSGHTYRIRAKNIGGKSAWSAPLDITTHPEIPDIPTNIMTTAEENSITATWYKVPHAASYEVEINGASVINVTNNQLVHSDLVPDSKHTYRVRAKNISGHSEWSSPITLSTFPSGSDSNILLTNIAAVVTNRFITISWDTVAPEAKYDIEVDGVLMDNGDDTIYHHTGLKANEFHTYKIRLKNEERPGEWVAILSLSTLPDPPDAPTVIEAFATNNSIELRWQKNTGATGYDIEIDGKTMDAGSNSSYTHDELSSGTAHTYRVRAKNETGVTAWSPAIVKSTTSPTYIVNGAKDKNFDLSLLASNVQDFSELTYVVTYDPNQLEVVDLFGFTPKLDLPEAGKIMGSNLEVTYAAGKITFKINQNVVPGTSWSGEITTIVFKSKIDGQSMIDVVVE